MPGHSQCLVEPLHWQMLYTSESRAISSLQSKMAGTQGIALQVSVQQLDSRAKVLPLLDSLTCTFSFLQSHLLVLIIS